MEKVQRRTELTQNKDQAGSDHSTRRHCHRNH